MSNMSGLLSLDTPGAAMLSGTSNSLGSIR